MADRATKSKGGLSEGAIDERINHVVNINSVRPMRRANPDVEGIRAYSHLHRLIPRLGFFMGNENRTPVDFQEIIACIAPRPALQITPKYDRFVVYDDVRHCVESPRGAYVPSEGLKIEFYATDPGFAEASDHNRLSQKILQKVLDWCGRKD